MTATKQFINWKRLMYHKIMRSPNGKNAIVTIVQHLGFYAMRTVQEALQ